MWKIKPLLVSIGNNCKQQKTKIYILSMLHELVDAYVQGTQGKKECIALIPSTAQEVMTTIRAI